MTSPPKTWLPGTADLTDGFFLLVLGGFALAGLRTTYASWWFLPVGGMGLVLGLLASFLVLARRQPVVAVAGATIIAYLLAGSAVIDPRRAIGGVVPTPTTLHEQALATVRSWKDLLTTLPPVPAAGTALTIPLLLGLVSSAAGFTLARTTRWPILPATAPLAVLIAVIALGTHEPGAKLVDGVAFAVVALCWNAFRGRRRQAVDPRRRASITRAVGGAAVLIVAGTATLLAAPLLPGTDTASRVVVRDHVTPPFDVSAYPSPLVGFRKYTKDARQLWDQTLFTVHGLPDGTPVRIATLDNYDGSVWGAINVAGDDFERVGATIPTASGPVTTVSITIAPAYAATSDINVWMPDVGQVRQVRFGGSDAAELDDGFRFNLATSTGIVPTRWRPGDTYTIRTAITNPVVPAQVQPYGPPALANSYSSLVASRTAIWTRGADSLGAQLRAVAAYMANEGAYSDGGPGEQNYLPGHSVGRLTSFFNDPRPVGDDEQYAAAYALIANYLGIPARVVLGALPEPDGTVRGADIHAWVEVHLANGVWATIPDKQFVPPYTHHPDKRPPTQAQSANAAVVPPPNAIHPPTSYVDDGSNASQNGGPSRNRGGSLPWIVRVLLLVLGWAAPPILFVLAVVGGIVGWKARRRRHRRTRGSPANRFAQGWRELVDHARDLGAVVPAGWTRQQEAAALAGHGIAPLAGRVDEAVYGAGDPSPDHADSFWRDVTAARRSMTATMAARQRLIAALSIRSLRRRPHGSPLDGL